MNVKEAAVRLGISSSLLYVLLANKKIRHERHGLGRGKIVISDEALEEYRRGQTVAVTALAASLPPLKHLKLPLPSAPP